MKKVGAAYLLINPYIRFHFFNPSQIISMYSWMIGLNPGMHDLLSYIYPEESQNG